MYTAPKMSHHCGARLMGKCHSDFNLASLYKYHMHTWVGEFSNSILFDASEPTLATIALRDTDHTRLPRYRISPRFPTVLHSFYKFYFQSKISKKE